MASRGKKRSCDVGIEVRIRSGTCHDLWHAEMGSAGRGTIGRNPFDFMGLAMLSNGDRAREVAQNASRSCHSVPLIWVDLRCPDRHRIVRKIKLDFQWAARTANTDERALKLRVGPGRDVMEGQSAVEDHAVGNRTQRGDVADKPEVSVPDRHDDPARHGSDHHWQR